MNLYSKLPIQLIRREVHLGNLLFDNNKFSGYIDFDLSQKNIRIIIQEIDVKLIRWLLISQIKNGG